MGFAFVACSYDSGTSPNGGIGTVDYGSMTDSRDGKTYKTVRIANQVWMAQNLNYSYTSAKFLYEDYSYTVYTSDSTSWCYNNEADFVLNMVASTLGLQPLTLWPWLRMPTIPRPAATTKPATGSPRRLLQQIRFRVYAPVAGIYQAMLNGMLCVLR